MNASGELIDYINQKGNNGALLFTGEWGCGKTYLIHKMAEKLNAENEAENKYEVIIVSLFGVNDVDALHKKVKESIVHQSFVNNGGQKSTWKNMGSNIIKMTTKLKDSFEFAKKINAAVTFGLYEFIQVEKELKQTKNGNVISRELVLVFDDFERCQISPIELIGAINTYSETKEIKTILVADEEKIISDKYNEYKEKLVWRTVKATPDFPEIIEAIIKMYPETYAGYSDFLKNNKSMIIQLFCESKSCNLRSLKSIFLNFERMFKVWKNADVSAQYLPRIFYTFGAMSFEYKAGRYTKGEYGYLFADQKTQEKYIEYDSHISGLIVLQEWVTEGRWDSSAFYDSIRMQFNIESLSADRAFMLTPFWDLDQKIINEGMPLIIDLAYDGKLSCDDLIELMKKIKAMRDNNINLPCNVDYLKIQKGFSLRKARIRRGEEEEPERRAFTDFPFLDIDEEAKGLYIEVDALKNLIFTWINRREFIKYLSNPGSVSSYELKDEPLDYFDDELLEKLIAAYEAGNNARKRNIALVFKGLSFEKSKISGEFELIVTLKNFDLLKQKLESMSIDEKDQISSAINNSFVKLIDKKISDVKAN